MKYTRQSVIDIAKSWVGKNESNGSYKEIIDIYNSYSGKLPRGIKMNYSWPWCAATWSAIAIKLGYTSIMPIEISCSLLIESAIKMGCWTENDGYIPSPGDAILYDWKDNGVGDNTGSPDHVGIVEYVNDGYITVIEGNYSNSVKRRTISVNGRYIRGFITPKYDSTYDIGTSIKSEKGLSIDTVAHEIITGLWGNGLERKEAVEAAGYNYDEVQKRVNEILNGSAATETSDDKPLYKFVEATTYAKSFDKILAGTYKTTTDLYCRNDAGTNKKALCLIPKDKEVKCYGYFTTYNGVKWLLIKFEMNGVGYTGFSSSKYLKK